MESEPGRGRAIGRAIGPALAILAWVAAGCSALRDRLLGRERAAPDRPAIEPSRRAESRRAGPRAVAQGLDHGVGSARGDVHYKKTVAQGRESGPGPPRLLGGPRIDGSTAWSVTAGPLGFRCWRELVGAAARGSATVEWPDPWGELVTLELDRGAPGSGTYVLSTGYVRIEIRRRWAEIQITALAAEVEGVESWYLREMPRALLWLLGKQTTCYLVRDAIAAAESLGVFQRRIEICNDAAGWQLKPGDERTLISKATIHPHWRSEDVLDGVDAGQRETTPNSLSVYDVIARMRAKRGPERAALRARWREHGWQEGEPVTRIELRLASKALRLVTEDGRQIDATHPGAALDAELLGKLWADGLTRHWMADASAGASRLRDNPPLEVWTRARAAGGEVEAVRLRRDVAGRQLDAVRKHALAQLGQVGARVEQLLEGSGDGEALRRAVDEVIAGTDWTNNLARARARLADLLEQAKGVP